MSKMNDGSASSDVTQRDVNGTITTRRCANIAAEDDDDLMEGCENFSRHFTHSVIPVSARWIQE